MQEPIKVLNMTRLFKKEIMLYSLFDIRFKKPFRVMIGVYFIILFLLIGLPIVKTFGVNVYSVMLGLFPLIVMANYMAKPIWNGRPFFSWLFVQIIYVLKPKIYYDNLSSKPLRDKHIDHYYVIPRRDDFLKLIHAKKNKKLTT